MPITPQNLIVKTYDKKWLHEVSIKSSGVYGNVWAEGVLIPYNSTTNEPAPSDLHERFRIDDIISKVQNGDIELQNAMGAVLIAVQKHA